MKLKKNLFLVAVVSAQVLAVGWKIASAADEIKHRSTPVKYFTVRVHSLTMTGADTKRLEAAVGQKISNILDKNLNANVKIVTTDDEKKAPAGAFEALGLNEHPEATVLLAEIIALPNEYELALELRLSQIQIDKKSDAFEPQYKTLWRIAETAQTPIEKANRTIDKVIETAMEKYTTTAGKKGLF
jgi:hypothetical protein